MFVVMNIHSRSSLISKNLYFVLEDVNYNSCLEDYFVALDFLWNSDEEIAAREAFVALNDEIVVVLQYVSVMLRYYGSEPLFVWFAAEVNKFEKEWFNFKCFLLELDEWYSLKSAMATSVLYEKLVSFVNVWLSVREISEDVLSNFESIKYF